MHWRQWFQECRNPCAVSEASLNPQVEKHSFSDYCLCSQHGQSHCPWNTLKCFVTQPLSYYFYYIILPVLQFMIFWFEFFLCIGIFFDKEVSEIFSFLNASFQKCIYPHCYAEVYSDCIFSLSEFVMVVKYFLFFPVVWWVKRGPQFFQKWSNLWFSTAGNGYVI